MMYMRREILRSSLIMFAVIISTLIVFRLLKLTATGGILIDFPYDNYEFRLKKSVFYEASTTRSPQYKCGLSKSCPKDDLEIAVSSGAASVKGPEICVNGEILIGTMKKNGGLGINIAVLNGQTGELINTDAFDMWSGDVEPLIQFLKSIKNGSLVLMASFDDPSTKLNDEARTLISQLGSSQIFELAFRDNWVFVGAKNINNMTSLEKRIKNDNAVNVYGAWPEIADLEGCIPLKQY